MDQSVSAGLSITISAMLQISLNVGASVITMTPANISIESPTITIASLGPTTILGTPVIIV